MPCNALLSSESDSTTIAVTVPSNLTVVSNGQLIGIESNTERKTKTYKHEITNNINTYSLSFNVGHFVELTKPYSDINGIERNLKFHVLDYNQDTASKFYEQTPIILREFEKLYGEFPFWEDGCKFIESTFSAMEHQSGIAMGSIYKNNWKEFNTTLIHELAHEWWGNSLTGKDYCDIWIHEGMATYSEALFLEEIYGKATSSFTVSSYEKTLRSIPEDYFKLFNVYSFVKKKSVKDINKHLGVDVDFTSIQIGRAYKSGKSIDQEGAPQNPLILPKEIGKILYLYI